MWIFHRAARNLPDPPDENRPINLKAISLHPERWEQDGLYGADGISLVEALKLLPGIEEPDLEASGAMVGSPELDVALRARANRRRPRRAPAAETPPGAHPARPSRSPIRHGAKADGRRGRERREAAARYRSAASIAKNILTTEAIVAEVPEKEGNGGGGGMPDMSGVM